MAGYNAQKLGKTPPKSANFVFFHEKWRIHAQKAVPTFYEVGGDNAEELFKNFVKEAKEYY